MIKVLLVEDDKELNSLIKEYIINSDFECISAFNGLDALSIFEEEKIDIIISDIMMPLCDGYTLAREIRLKDNQIPIIFMSARDDKPSKQIAYKAGVDDYITKPFDLDELILKLRAIARRLNISKNTIIEIGNFKMDFEEHIALCNGEELNLTVREFNILYGMLQNPKKTFTRSKLMEDFWDYDSSATSRTVDVYMAKLRDKTKDCDGFEIQTVHGLGYKMVLK